MRGRELLTELAAEYVDLAYPVVVHTPDGRQAEIHEVTVMAGEIRIELAWPDASEEGR